AATSARRRNAPMTRWRASGRARPTTTPATAAAMSPWPPSPTARSSAVPAAAARRTADRATPPRAEAWGVPNMMTPAGAIRRALSYARARGLFRLAPRQTEARTANFTRVGDHFRQARHAGPGNPGHRHGHLQLIVGAHLV